MATRFGKLPLDDAPRTKVFRAIDDTLRENATLKNVIKTFYSWRGGPEDKKEFAQAQAPALRIYPAPGPESYWYPGATKGTLAVRFELLIKGLALDDVENLWYAIERALIPRDQASMLAIHDTLKAAGAMTGVITFTDPASDQAADAGSDGQFYPIGQCQLEIQTS